MRLPLGLICTSATLPYLPKSPMRWCAVHLRGMLPTNSCCESLGGGWRKQRKGNRESKVPISMFFSLLIIFHPNLQSQIRPYLAHTRIAKSLQDLPVGQPALVPSKVKLRHYPILWAAISWVVSRLWISWRKRSSNNTKALSQNLCYTLDWRILPILDFLIDKQLYIYL